MVGAKALGKGTRQRHEIAKTFVRRVAACGTGAFEVLSGPSGDGTPARHLLSSSAHPPHPPVSLSRP